MEFGLRFETQEVDEDAERSGEEAEKNEDAPAGEADIVSLDSFRK